MQTNSNPQPPIATTAEVTDTAALESDATVQATPAEGAEPKEAPAKKPVTKKPAGRRPATKQDTKSGPKTKAPNETPKPAPPRKKGPREGATMWAILRVLGATTEPMSAKDIYAQIAKRKLAIGLNGKTPDQSVAAALAVAAKQGRYVERAAPGMFRILKERS